MSGPKRNVTRLNGWRRTAQEQTTRGLSTALGHVSGRQPLLPEYPLHPRPRWGWSGPAPRSLSTAIAATEADSADTVERALALAEWCPSVARKADEAAPGEPCWDNDYWGGIDAVVQVAELRHRKPERYIEVGSGWSTRFARRAVKEFDLPTAIISIDPRPRADIDSVCDLIVRQPLEDVDLSLFGGLTAGDVLFIDGSHTAFMNSDATILFGEVLPELPAGVMVAIDDIFLPWDYPPTWEPRLYGEQYLLASLLTAGAAGWTVRFPAFHLTRLSPDAPRFDPLWKHVETRFGRTAVSFWMERT